MSRLDMLEARVLGRVQRLPGHRYAVAPAHVLSSAGEHAWLWLAGSALCAAVDQDRRRDWAVVGTAALGAHAAAVVVKRVVRRPRPAAEAVHVLDRTSSSLSFPSAHAASTTATAVAARQLVGAPIAASVAVAMYAARLVLGVHYPTDVLAGAALGVAGARAAQRLLGPGAR